MRFEFIVGSSGASAISEGDMFMYSCSAQLISFEVDSISKEINCAEHEYMNMSPSLIALAPLLIVGYHMRGQVISVLSLEGRYRNESDKTYRASNVITYLLHTCVC